MMPARVAFPALEASEPLSYQFSAESFKHAGPQVAGPLIAIRSRAKACNTYMR